MLEVHILYLIIQTTIFCKDNIYSRDGLSPDLDHKSANDFKSFSSLFEST